MNLRVREFKCLSEWSQVNTKRGLDFKFGVMTAKRLNNNVAAQIHQNLHFKAHSELSNVRKLNTKFSFENPFIGSKVISVYFVKGSITVLLHESKGNRGSILS